jgi:hypothetical protein
MLREIKPEAYPGPRTMAIPRTFWIYLRHLLRPPCGLICGSPYSPPDLISRMPPEVGQASGRHCQGPRRRVRTAGRRQAAGGFAEAPVGLSGLLGGSDRVNRTAPAPPPGVAAGCWTAAEGANTPNSTSLRQADYPGVRPTHIFRILAVFSLVDCYISCVRRCPHWVRTLCHGGKEAEDALVGLR